jgi:serine-type D-Ala-D-Ala carboxypeptidase
VTGGAERRVYALLERAVEARAFPSACLLAAVRGEPVLHRAYGAGGLDTSYDLASLTKVLATTAVVMQLTAEGALAPTHKVTRWLPELKQPGAERLTIRHLLTHSSGLPAWLPLFEDARHRAPRRRRTAVRRVVAAAPLEARPGTRACYSDLGFILLDWALERCAGARLDKLARRLVFAPLGLRRTRFVDLHRQGAVAAMQALPVAPTERCPWRGRRLRGEVHDDNCHAMGGIAGHAGLFSTAFEVHLILRELVAACSGMRSLFSPAVVQRFFQCDDTPGTTRALGWDTPSARGSSAGRLFSRRAVGHLGFTGTSIWIDLPRRLSVVLLTNRVYHGREPNPMIKLRPRLHDAVVRAVES